MGGSCGRHPTVPPQPPPPAALTHSRPTGPRLTPAAARQPPWHEYTPGGHAVDNGSQADAGRGGGAGGGGAAPPPPPPLPPPSLRATGATLRPLGAQGTPPLPKNGPRRGGTGCDLTCTPRASAPPAASSRGGRGRRASPHQRARAALGPSLGAAHGGAPGQYGGRAPHDPPHDHCPLRGGQRGGSGPKRPPGERSTGRPSSPPPPGAALEECAEDKRGARVGNCGPPPGGGAGRTRRDPPPTPPTRPQAAGAPVPPAEAGGMVPPPPARERSRSTARPPAPAADSYRNRGEQGSLRQRARTPHRSRPEKAGKHDPEWYGDHAPHDQNNASDTRFVACPGKADERNEAERPPALLTPPAAQTGGTAHGPPPPPRPAPRHTNPTDPPHGGRTAPSQVGGSQDRIAPPQARQTEQGTGAGPRGTTLPSPSAGTARGAHATPPRGGGEQTPRERERTHTQRARGDYQKGNQTELAERRDHVEWHTSERG